MYFMSKYKMWKYIELEHRAQTLFQAFNQTSIQKTHWLWDVGAGSAKILVSGWSTKNSSSLNDSYLSLKDEIQENFLTSKQIDISFLTMKMHRTAKRY